MKKIINKNCEHCDKEFSTTCHTRQQQFCSVTCSNYHVKRKVARPILERIFEKLQKTDTCWLWKGTVTIYGYGQIAYQKKQVSVHRLMFELHNPEIDITDLDICHTCDIRNCCNPDHLFAGTNADNMADRNRKNRQVKLKGSSNGFSKLTESQVLEIRSANKTAKVLAEIFNVSKQTIDRIRTRRGWQHV